MRASVVEWLEVPTLDPNIELVRFQRKAPNRVCKNSTTNDKCSANELLLIKQ